MPAAAATVATALTTFFSVISVGSLADNIISVAASSSRLIAALIPLICQMTGKQEVADHVGRVAVKEWKQEQEVEKIGKCDPA